MTGEPPFFHLLSPGLRIGWLAASPALREKHVILKQGADLHTPTLSQVQIARYLEAGDIEKNLVGLRQTYKERRDAMLGALAREMPAARVNRPEGGLFVWVELPEHLNARKLLEVCLETHRVAFVPGDAFFPEHPRANTLRLNFSNMPVPLIEEGVKRLASAVRDLLEPSATAAATRSAG